MASQGRGGEPTRTRSRYPAIDILRGSALISMASTHVSHYQLNTVIVSVFHGGLWVDGAFFFVALSGMVVGLVHRRLTDRGGLPPSALKLAKRAGFLYLVHVGLVLFSVLAGWADHDDIIDAAPTWTGLADVPGVMEQVFLLRLAPAYNGVLSMYVVFLLLAIPAVALLHRGHWRAVVAGSLAIYCGGWLAGGVAFGRGDFSLTAWQALFMGGLLVGWTWEHERLRLLSAERRRQIVTACSVAAVGFISMALVAPGTAGRVFGRLLDKLSGGPLAFTYAAVVLVAGYVLVDRALRYHWFATLLTPIRILGLKGLPGFVALQVMSVLLDLFPGLPRTDATIVAVVILCGVTEYVAFRWQERRRRPAEAGPVVTSDVAGEEPAVAVGATPPCRDVSEVDGAGLPWAAYPRFAARSQPSSPR